MRLNEVQAAFQRADDQRKRDAAERVRNIRNDLFDREDSAPLDPLEVASIDADLSQAGLTREALFQSLASMQHRENLGRSVERLVAEHPQDDYDAAQRAIDALEAECSRVPMNQVPAIRDRIREKQVERTAASEKLATIQGWRKQLAAPAADPLCV